MDDITIIKSAYLVLLTLKTHHEAPVQKLLAYMRDRIAQKEGLSPEIVQIRCGRKARYSLSIRSTLRNIMVEAEKGDKCEKENSSNDS